MLERYVDWLQRARWLVVIGVLSVAVVAASGMRYLGFDASYEAFFSERNPQLSAWHAFQRVYSRSDSILFVLAPRGGEVFTREALAAVEWLTEQAWQVPWSRRVDSVSNFQYTEAEGDDLFVHDLVEHAEALDDAALATVRAVALAEPLLVNRLIAPDARVTAVNVAVQIEQGDADKTAEAMEFTYALRERFTERYPFIDVYLTGGAVLDHAFPEATLDDLRQLVPLSYAVIFLIMLVLLRSWSGTLATALVMVLAATTGMGLAGWLGIALTPASVGAATIIMTLAVADSIHILITLIRAQAAGHDRRAALLESLRINLQPVTLTSLTTAIGFMSMNFSDAPPFRDLGNITAMGVLAAWVASLTLLPALLLMLPLRIRAGKTGGVMMQRLADFVVRYRRALLWGLGVAIVAVGAMIPRLELNDQFVQYFDESMRFRRDTDFATAHLTGIYQLEYSLAAGQPSGINEPAYLQHLRAFAEWYARQPETVHVNSLHLLLERLNKNLHGDDPAWQRLPEQRELAAQYLLLYEFSLPYGLDLNDQINVDKSASRFTVITRDLSTRELRDLEARAEDWMRAHLPQTMQTLATGPAIMFAYISERNIRTMLWGTALAVLLIVTTLVVALRSLRLGLISLVPNLVPAVLAFGTWAMTVGQVGLVVSVVFAMALGIIVDDTVHFLSKYLRARRVQGLAPADAVRYAFATVGTALWVTSVILIGGFSLLAFSPFQLNQHSGMLMAMTIGYALLADFLFLPPLLMAVDRAARAPRRASGDAPS
jgi:predicted RND superfamily exporter protein